MSEFAFFRFKSTNMLTMDEEQQKEEIVKLTEEVLEAKGIECDRKIASISEEKLREILEEVRKLRIKRKRLLSDSGVGAREGEAFTENKQREQQERENEKEVQYIR
jgi:hypothetical protein